MHGFLQAAAEVLRTIDGTQTTVIASAAEHMAESIASQRVVYLFGSGHSVLPVMDLFPRYGSFPGFVPIVDPRLLWFTPVGPGGARELLWIERQEGYVENLLASFRFDPKDTMWVFSHGGLNAAPIEAAVYARDRGLTVVAVTSVLNQKAAMATHSSGRKLRDVADIVIDNCVAPEDALVSVDGWPYKVGAGSTVAAVAISMTVLSEVAKRLSARGIVPPVFVSPNILPGLAHNRGVFESYTNVVRQL